MIILEEAMIFFIGFATGLREITDVTERIFPPDSPIKMSERALPNLSGIPLKA